MGYIGYIFGLNFTNTITKSIQKTTNSVQQDMTSTQETIIKNAAASTAEVTFKNYGTYKCSGSITVEASAKSEVKTLLAISQSDEFEFDNDLFSQLVLDIETEVDQAQEGGLLGNIGDTNFSNTVTDTLQENVNTITQSINTTLKTSIDQSASATSGIVFENHGTIESGGNCKIDSNSIAESLADVISDKVNEVLLTNKIISELDAKITSKVTQTSKGMDIMAVVVIGIVATLIMGGGGMATSGSEGMSDTTKYIIYFLLFVILCSSIGMGLGILLSDRSCDNKIEPTNLDVCEDDDDIKCLCSDDSDYIKRWWKPWGISVFWICLYIIIVCIIVIIGIVMSSGKKTAVSGKTTAISGKTTAVPLSPATSSELSNGGKRKKC